MDLHGRPSSGARALPAIVIPEARQPLQAPSSAAALSLVTTVGEAPATQLRGVLRTAEAAVVVIGVYVLIGVGIGAAAGSLLVGAASGLLAGVCAIAAILLIRGSAVSAGRDAGAPDYLRQALNPR